MSNSFRVVIFVLLFTLAGCASAPKLDTTQFSQTEAKMLAAAEQKAEHYAPVELRIAQERLQLARSLFDARKHLPAARALELAGLQADLARLKSETAQMRERVDLSERENQQLQRELLPQGSE